MASHCVLTLQFAFTLDSNVGIPEGPLRQQHDAAINPERILGRQLNAALHNSQVSCGDSLNGTQPETPATTK